MITLSASTSSKEEDLSPDLVQSASYVQDILNWIPVRLFTLFFALGGHFVNVLSCWRKKTTWGLTTNDKLLTECGIAALGDNEDTIAQDGSAGKSAIGLLDRAFVITLIVLAVFVLLL
jgi:membrane protein required for beta-lactamase induction